MQLGYTLFERIFSSKEGMQRTLVVDVRNFYHGREFKFLGSFSGKTVSEIVRQYMEDPLNPCNEEFETTTIPAIRRVTGKWVDEPVDNNTLECFEREYLRALPQKQTTLA